MKRSLISSIGQSVGEEVLIQGWIKTVRKQGGIVFVLLRDVTGVAQAIVMKSQGELFEQIKELPVESVVNAVGKVQAQAQAPGGFELHLQSLEILSLAESPLPIPITAEKGNEASVSKRLDWRWLDLRDSSNALIFKVWTELERGMRLYFEKENFIQLYTPAFMTAPSESGAEVFKVEYFEGSAYLAQSPQFYKQMGIAAGLEKVFIVGPVFRAEPSFTARHMTEFTGWDFEASYVTSHHDVMAIEEELLISGLTQLQKSVLPELKLPSTPFPKLTMKEAKARLAEAGVTSEKEGDLSPEEERVICELVKQESNSDFVFITDYPITVRPFYHMRSETDPTLTKSFDLLYKGVEISTGAQREHRPEVLHRQAVEKGIVPASLEYYFNFFKYGCPPHGGVGMGPGRIVMKLLDLPSVKEATYLPRDVNRLTP
ncbi:MAG: aspartate--tRNA(Asn) ligase [bacterium]|nr:aspartate--tRNA(Asn) ligase [bacterium]